MIVCHYKVTKRKTGSQNGFGRDRGGWEERTMRGLKCYIIVLILLFLTVGSISLHAEGNEARGNGGREYEELEKEYQSRVMDVLAQYGLSSGGITLTKIIQIDDTREYQLEIHHARMGKWTEQQRGRLAEGIHMLGAPDGTSSVRVVLNF